MLEILLMGVFTIEVLGFTIALLCVVGARASEGYGLQAVRRYK